MAAAAAAQVEGGTPGCARGGERHCPRPLPLAQGAGGTRDWCVISLPGCGIHRLCIKARALHPERKGKKKKKKRGKAKKPPPLLPRPDLATCCLPPFGECYCNPCLLRSSAPGKKSRGQPRTPGWKARQGGSGSRSSLAMLASRCKCAVSPGVQSSSGKPNASPGTSNSSTCLPITQ